MFTRGPGLGHRSTLLVALVAAIFALAPGVASGRRRSPGPRCPTGAVGARELVACLPPFRRVRRELGQFANPRFAERREVVALVALRSRVRARGKASSVTPCNRWAKGSRFTSTPAGSPGPATSSPRAPSAGLTRPLALAARQTRSTQPTRSSSSDRAEPAQPDSSRPSDSYWARSQDRSLYSDRSTGPLPRLTSATTKKVRGSRDFDTVEKHDGRGPRPRPALPLRLHLRSPRSRGGDWLSQQVRCDHALTVVATLHVERRGRLTGHPWVDSDAGSRRPERPGRRLNRGSLSETLPAS